MNQSVHENRLQDLAPLDQVGWLAAQPQDLKAWVVKTARWRYFAAGQDLYLAGDEPDGMYGLGAGALEVTFPLLGDEPVTIHRAEPGFWIGEAAEMAGVTRMVSVAAAVKSRVLHIPLGPLRGLLDSKPIYWRALYEQSFANVRTAVSLLAEALALTPRARLARLLLRLADADGRVRGNQEEFGRVIGMTRSGVRRSLASLVEAGTIRTGYRWLEIVDGDRLRRIANEA
jgi:CRP-like cAMP-binding protein